MRQSNTTFVNLRAALDDLDPLVETAKPATKDLAPFLRELGPVLAKAVPVFKDFRLSVRRKGFANDTAELLGFLPGVQERASKAFPHAEQAIEDFQPTLNFARAYTPGHLQRLRQARSDHRLLRRQRPLCPRPARSQPVQRDAGGELEPIPSQQQYVFGGSAPSAALPGGAPAAADGSSPFTEPPFAARRQLLGMRPGRRATRTMSKLLLAAGSGRRDRGRRPARVRRQRHRGYVVRAIFDNGGFMVNGEQSGRRRHRRRNRIGRRDDAGRDRRYEDGKPRPSRARRSSR
jgi:hypothetical protein